MSDSDILELELASDPEELPGVRQALNRWAAAHGWSDDQASEISLAVDEALCNVIRHGYEGQTNNRIKLSASPVHDPKEGDGVELRVRDFGKQVDPADIRGRDLDNVRPGGLGVHLIRAMMNSVEYTPAKGGGMLLVMRKYKGHLAARRKTPG